MHERSRRSPDSVSFLGGLLIPLFALGLIFGEALGGLAVLAFAAAVALVGAASPVARDLLAHSRQVPAFRRAAGLLIPLVALAGIFTNGLLIPVVLGLAFVGFLVMVAGHRPGPIWAPAQEELIASVDASVRITSVQATPALPAQASGEKIDEIDLRALCRGLPANLSGQIVATVEHLELVMAEAGRSGDSRRAYDARQGLREYLPGTVGAWQALPEGQRDTAELERALTQVRQIAGPDDTGGEVSRKAWETQQRFLASRAEKSRS